MHLAKISHILIFVTFKHVVYELENTKFCTKHIIIYLIYINVFLSCYTHWRVQVALDIWAKKTNIFTISYVNIKTNVTDLCCHLAYYAQ